MRTSSSCRRALLVAVALVAGAFVIVGAEAAGAKNVATSCTAIALNPDGTPGGELPGPFALNAGIADFGGPTEVNAGATFTAVAPSIAVDVPKTVEAPLVGTVAVIDAENIELTIQIDGAASIGSPTLSGGDVINPTATKIAPNKILVKLPGNVAGSDFPNATAHFVPGNASFTSPKISLPITAGAAGTTITAKLVHLASDSGADPFKTAPPSLPTHAECDALPNALGAVQVVTPPPPGAPDAVADRATTDQGRPVSIDVLDNDMPNATLALDDDSLAITRPPAHGDATVNNDRTVQYTPAAGFSGTDTFTYKVCSVAEEATTTTLEEIDAVTEPCDTAIVTIEVVAPAVIVPQGTPATTVPTTSTVAAAANELPRTGRGSVPLAGAGLAAVALGLVSIGLGCRRVS